MKKRLRKKRHVGEFQEFCFYICLKIKPELTEPELDAWWDDLIETVEGLNLCIGGGGLHELVFFCSRLRGRAPVTLDDREAIGRWLAQDCRVSSYDLGNLVDAWYPAK